MRLHHLDFPHRDQSQGIRGWEQSDQLEPALPATSTSSDKIGTHFAATSTAHTATTAALGMTVATAKTSTRQPYQSAKNNVKNGTKPVAKSDSIQTNFSRRISVKAPSHGLVNVSSLSIEFEVLESFQEFATFLEHQNPICPAELLDTPEKLMNVLSWESWR